jgi:hypothetical protein
MAFPHNQTYPQPMQSGIGSITNAYWVPEPEFVARQSLLPIDHHLGFSTPKPWPLPPPQTIFNGVPVPGVREMVYTQFTDTPPVGGRIPDSAGKPLVRPSEFRRAKFVHIV